MVMLYLVRQSVSFAIHLAAGMAVGALTLVALERALRRQRHGIEPPAPPDVTPVAPGPEPGPVPPDVGPRV